MKVSTFLDNIKNIGIDNIIGVPDSTLKHFCDYVSQEKNIKHCVVPNEGSAIGFACGVYLSTGKPACVYMQNSGVGNAINPITSLVNKEIYDIPMLLLIGWRGAPKEKDEPQHKFMGKITENILDVIDIEYAVIDSYTTEKEMNNIFKCANNCLRLNKQYAIIIKRESFDQESECVYKNSYSLGREEAIKIVLKNISEDDIVVSTTGKISREVYEQNNLIVGNHDRCFLTVGGMGHASMIALGISKNKSTRKVFCFDGDGACLMHMGNIAFIGQEQPENFIHIVFNNNAHESVGGMPTGAKNFKYFELSKICGYKCNFCVDNSEKLKDVLKDAYFKTGPILIEINVAIGSRNDLGRPKETAVKNKESFMNFISKEVVL